MIFANPMAVPAMEVKPRRAAMSAMMRNVIAQDNIVRCAFGVEVAVKVRLLNRIAPAVRV